VGREVEEIGKEERRRERSGDWRGVEDKKKRREEWSGVERGWRREKRGEGRNVN
jgi:hypothetical protein